MNIQNVYKFLYNMMIIYKSYIGYRELDRDG